MVVGNGSGLCAGMGMEHIVTHDSDVPRSLDVCHHCDNRKCVRPSHLFIGTRQDNMRDASAKGRIRTPGLKGEQCGQAKLTEADVRRILASGHPYVLSKELGVSYEKVKQIRMGTAWKHVPRG